MKLRYKFEKEDVLEEMFFNGTFKIGFGRIFRKESILKLCEILKFKPSVIILGKYKVKEEELSTLPVEYYYFHEEFGYSILEFKEEDFDKILEVYTKNIKNKGIILMQPMGEKYKKNLPVDNSWLYTMRNTANAMLIMIRKPFWRSVFYCYNTEHVSYKPDRVIEIDI